MRPSYSPLARRRSADRPAGDCRDKVRVAWKHWGALHRCDEPGGHSIRSLATAGRWVQTVDPGVHRRVKGLRLVSAYALAALLGAQVHAIQGLSGASLSALAAGFALWASVSEAQVTRAKSSLDLVLFCAGAALGAASVTLLAPLLRFNRAELELVLLTGTFLVGYLRRFGLTGTGLGSQIYIGQLLAYGAADRSPDLQTIVQAGAIAALAAVVPRVLSGPAEHPPPAPPRLASPAGALGPSTLMGLQAATAGLVIVAVNAWLGLTESVWAITACTYVVAASRAATIERVRRHPWHLHRRPDRACRSAADHHRSTSGLAATALLGKP